jgi:hypothetical protein
MRETECDTLEKAYWVLGGKSLGKSAWKTKPWMTDYYETFHFCS